MQLTFTEMHTPTVGLQIQVYRQLHTEQSDFQRIDVFECEEFGRFLTLDGYMMLTERDEFIYHEMMVHVPLAVLGEKIKKVLVIGSGPIVIGQAAEFDYAGTQACLALREEGYEVVLANSNPATIMTDTTIADKVYMEPLTLEYLARICRYERPDAIVPGIGGQTATEVGARLKRLAASRQVIVVTHLAQVASWADAQFVVTKEPPDADDDDLGVVTTIAEVNGETRVHEIARMLSGSESEASLDHARELLSDSRLTLPLAGAGAAGD